MKRTIVSSLSLSLSLSLALAALPLALAAGSSTSSSSTTTNSTEPAVCYHLDGSEASDHVPCGTGDVANCCNSNDICMSNGLCFQQGDRGLVLSRGTCTDLGWGNRCFAPCANHHRDSDMAIVNVGFESDEPEYCCGAVTAGDDDEEVSCEHGEPFHIQSGTAILNVAGLAEHSSDKDTDTDTDDDDDHASGEEDEDSHDAEDSEEDEDSHDTEDSEEDHDHEVHPGLAIALGVGIPLGLIVMGGVLWAVWERRRRQLQTEEESLIAGGVRGRGGGGGGETVMTALTLPRLHHRYGPIPSPVPSWSGRATPSNGSGMLHPVESASQSPPRVVGFSPLHGDGHMDGHMDGHLDGGAGVGVTMHDETDDEEHEHERRGRR
ncbi:hypothetical protein BJX70DRAFT_381950 [Aspergillus crustosus]